MNARVTLVRLGWLQDLVIKIKINMTLLSPGCHRVGVSTVSVKSLRIILNVNECNSVIIFENMIKQPNVGISTLWC